MNEKIFRIYKFRMMTDKRDENGNLLPDSERLTKFGKIIRSSSPDELPELLNIAKGDMAIVGPRPLLTQYLPYYREEERERHAIRPRLTNWMSTVGKNINEVERLVAEYMGATYKGVQTGTFGKYNTVSFNGNNLLFIKGEKVAKTA